MEFAELLTLAGTFLAGGAAGFAADRVIVNSKRKKILEAEGTLIRNFGALTTNTSFSFDEAMDWITARDELMQDGCDAFIFKAGNDNFKLINQRFNIDFNTGKYLVVAIVKDRKNIQDSLLVKYDVLDKRLEQELAQGNGALIIEGNK